VLILHFL
jgi:cysteinyl-tRNA synthetase